MSGNGNGDAIDSSAYDSDDDALRAPADDAPIEERVLYVVETVKLGRAEQRRMRLQIKGVGDSVTALAEAQAADVDNIVGELAEQRGTLERIESVLLTVCAKLENHFRESEPPTLERLQEMRAAADKTAAELRAADEKNARRTDRIEVERRVRGAKLDAKIDEHSREIAGLKADAKDTTRQATMTAARSIEVLAHERDTAHEMVVETRGHVAETRVAAANAEVAKVKSKREAVGAFAIKVAPVVLAAVVAAWSTKLQACSPQPSHVPAPAGASSH